MKLYLVICSHLVGFFLCALSGLPTAFGAAKPNVVVIMSDDAGFNNFGFTSALYGGTQFGETPNLDALAGQSVVLKQGYVAAPLCSTSRAGLLTGQYVQRYGFENNIATANQAGAIEASGLRRCLLSASVAGLDYLDRISKG